VPQVLAAVRTESYQHYAWPKWFGKAFAQNGLVAAIIAALALNAFLVSAMALIGNRQLLSPVVGGDFYRLIPHSVMMLAFGGVSLFVLAALLIGVVRCWRDSGERFADFFRPAALTTALKDALTLTYLHGSGEDCVAETSERRSPWRRYFHHCTFYGFALCFAATLVAAVYHYAFGSKAPYTYMSVPVLLGTVGGLGLLIGPIGLFALSDRTRRGREESNMSVAFIALLSLTSLTGLLLLAMRDSAMLGILLMIHLALVMALFLMLPYGKFVHAIYRFMALLTYAREGGGHSQPRRDS
jgi:citrate/tricarballylate utilization protein